MNFIYSSSFLKLLGWTLVNSVWQMGALWLLFTMITANGTKYSSATRHALALWSLCAGSLVFSAQLAIGGYYILSGRPQTSSDFIQDNLFSGFSFIERSIHMVTPFLSVGYLVILSFLFARFVRDYRQHRQLFHSLQPVANKKLADFLSQMSAQIGIKKNVEIWLSHLVDSPLTIGYWKPIILFPVALLNKLSVSQAEAVIIHELRHIRRNDYLINLIMAFAEIFLFFNPFARSFAGIIHKERENSCDDAVLQFKYDPYQYSLALLTLEKNRNERGTLGMAARGKGDRMLLNRVNRMVNRKTSPAPVKLKLAGCLLSFALAITTGRQGMEKIALNPDLENKIAAVSLDAITARPAKESSPSVDRIAEKYFFETPKIAVQPSKEKKIKDKTYRPNAGGIVKTKAATAEIKTASKDFSKELPKTTGDDPEHFLSYASIPTPPTPPTVVRVKAISQETFRQAVSSVENLENILMNGQAPQLIQVAENAMIIVKENGEIFFMTISASGIAELRKVNRAPSTPRKRKIVRI